MRTRALCDVACELNRTHAVNFVAIMVGFKLELTEPTEAEAYAYFEQSVRDVLLEFFRTIKRRAVLSDGDFKRHKERCLWLFEQISKTESPLEYAEALKQHLELLRGLLR